MQHNSIILNTDSYKVSMWKEYPPGTEYVYSYIESRGGKYDQTVFFGLQAFISEYLTKPITQEDIDFAEKVWTIHGEPFNRQGWEYILEKHGGYLPVRIKAVQEGLVIPTKNVLATIENTDPNVPWITTWVETALLRAIWYPTTVATISWSIKQLIKKYLEKSGDLSGLPFKLHDFGARGVSSMESAGVGGAAHLVNFMGSDTMTGMLYLNEYYNAPLDTIAFSIPAAEHSTITSWGKEREVDAYANMVDQFSKPGSIYAVVSDSYDIYGATEMWGTVLKDKVVSSGGTLVIRPDSGDPVVVIPRMLLSLEKNFGITINSKGYKVLNNVRIIWGDGIDEVSIDSILRVTVDLHGYSADNFAFGMGGALLQHCNRDTQKFAMKASAAKINGQWVDVFKDPITDSGKVSKKGRVTLYKDRSTGQYYSGVEDWMPSELEIVYEDGIMVRHMTLQQVRENSEK